MSKHEIQWKRRWLENQETFLQNTQNDLHSQRDPITERAAKLEKDLNNIRKELIRLCRESKKIEEVFEPLIEKTQTGIKEAKENLERSLKIYTLKLLDESKGKDLLEAFEAGNVIYKAFFKFVDGRSPVRARNMICNAYALKYPDRTIPDTSVINDIATKIYGNGSEPKQYELPKDSPCGTFTPEGTLALCDRRKATSSGNPTYEATESSYFATNRGTPPSKRGKRPRDTDREIESEEEYRSKRVSSSTPICKYRNSRY